MRKLFAVESRDVFSCCLCGSGFALESQTWCWSCGAEYRGIRHDTPLHVDSRWVRFELVDEISLVEAAQLQSLRWIARSVDGISRSLGCMADRLGDNGEDRDR